MFKDKTISKRVMAVIKQKIADRQAMFNEEVKALEDKFDAEALAMEAKFEEDAKALAESHVGAILSKII